MAPMLTPGMTMAQVQGPLLIGYLFSYLLYGVLMVQLYIYTIHFKKDATWIKVMVWSLFAIETLGSALVATNAWKDLAAGWGDLSSLRYSRWELTALLPVNGAVAIIVQFFLCQRIWTLGKLSKTRIMMMIAVLISLVSIMSCAFTFYCGIMFQVDSDDYPALARTGQLILGWLAGNLVVDLGIAATMSIYLHRSKNGFWATDTLLNKIILSTVQTGCVTAVLSIIELILYVRNERSNDHFAACLVNAKLYSNVLMATLNARILNQNHNGGNVSNGSFTATPASARKSLTIINSPLWDDLNGTANDESRRFGTRTATLHSSTFEAAKSSDSATVSDIDLEKTNA